MIRRTVRFIDERTSAAPFVKKAVRYVFPDHWSFLLGEVALYSFVVLVATGVYLTFYFEPVRVPDVVYQGRYEPLHGQVMSPAYRSVVEISFDVRAGLLMRQTHHWAANVFVAAILLHLLRIFFTGAFRKPRELTYLLGLAMLALALPEGYIGYSLIDDLLSGMGLVIGYAVVVSIPFFGANLAALIWGGEFPGDPEFWPRMYIAHVLIIPVLIGILLTLHLVLVSTKHHTQFRRKPSQTERKVVGTPTFPGQTPRSLGLMLGVAAVLFLLGGLVQINPVWLWGPYELWLSTNGAQPDWYLGWFIGALRLMLPWEPHAWDYTFVPNAFWGGAAFPLFVFALLAAWPWLERRVTGDRAVHNLLQRPRDNPWRTAIGVGLFTWVFLIFFAGSADRVYVFAGLNYVWQIWIYRVLIWVLPFVAGAIAYRVCIELKRIEVVEHDREEAEAWARRERARARLREVERASERSREPRP